MADEINNGMSPDNDGKAAGLMGFDSQNPPVKSQPPKTYDARKYGFISQKEGRNTNLEYSPKKAFGDKLEYGLNTKFANKTDSQFLNKLDDNTRNSYLSEAEKWGVNHGVKYPSLKKGVGAVYNHLKDKGYALKPSDIQTILDTFSAINHSISDREKQGKRTGLDFNDIVNISKMELEDLFESRKNDSNPSNNHSLTTSTLNPTNAGTPFTLGDAIGDSYRNAEDIRRYNDARERDVKGE